MLASCHVSFKLMALKDTNVSPALKDALPSYVLSFQAERCHQRMRYYWTICEAQHPDELVSWGYAATQHQAEAAAQDEEMGLLSGLTEGGRVALKPFSHRQY